MTIQIFAKVECEFAKIEGENSVFLFIVLYVYMYVASVNPILSPQCTYNFKCNSFMVFVVSVFFILVKNF